MAERVPEELVEAIEGTEIQYNPQQQCHIQQKHPYGDPDLIEINGIIVRVRLKSRNRHTKLLKYFNQEKLIRQQLILLLFHYHLDEGLKFNSYDSSLFVPGTESGIVPSSVPSSELTIVSGFVPPEFFSSCPDLEGTFTKSVSLMFLQFGLELLPLSIG
ncbi:hypothetical protein HAX54_027946 [Datura stramonium]|uniref:Uncharacterized protein n=1 Tax=Datura stramonium TaxID=4076 RepID=A0ABS8V4T7_DATST|nr:hypothetical protein [Datura stramonium]